MKVKHYIEMLPHNLKHIDHCCDKMMQQYEGNHIRIHPTSVSWGGAVHLTVINYCPWCGAKVTVV
ncbi:hypothetical protein LCGC14_1467940 [marine sediment metagenome]|uniref:Uncharacterized protein n=1 Tax=marine sediment metagenome TaxID=412755 RepID=A0A0F9JD77_9ZZZZ